MFRSMSRLWGASGKFRVGLTILLALVVLAPLHPLISLALFGQADPLEIGADGAWLLPSSSTCSERIGMAATFSSWC